MKTHSYHILYLFRLIDNEEAVEKVEEDDENKDGKVTFAEIAKKHYGYTEEDLIKLKEEHGDDLEKSEGDEEEIEILKVFLAKLFNIYFLQYVNLSILVIK